MEEILSANVQQRYQKLLEIVSKAKICLQASEIPRDELTSIQITLKHSVKLISEDLHTYMEKVKVPDVPLIKKYYAEKMNAEDILTQIDVLQKQYEHTNSNQTNQARLPKLDLGKYDGNVLTWNSFWDKFQANVDSRNISDVEKLSYLISSLEGTAYEAVEGLGTTHLNYSIAVDILRTRFGQEQKVVDAHNDALHKLDKAQATPQSCRHTLNCIEKHLRVLERMGENVDGSHLRVILLSKFPENVLYQTSLLTVEDSSVKALRKALDTVVTALERSCVAITAVPSTSSTDILHVTVESKRKRKNPRPVKEIKTIKKKRIQKCEFCLSENTHYSEDCLKYRSYKERKQQLKEKCFICFRKGHLASKCTSKVKCFHCGKKHNRAMCRLKTTTAQNKGEVKISDKNTEDDNLVFITKQYNFLQTAVAQARVKDKTLPCRILLDCGSQRSYMTASLAKKLNVKPDKEDNLAIYTFGSTKPNKISSPSTEVTLITKRRTERKVRVNIVSYITDRIPVAKVNSTQRVDIIADDSSTGEGIDILIGNDLYSSFMKLEHIKLKDCAYLINTEFGWIISGSLESEDNSEKNALSVITYCQCHNTDCPYFTEPDLPLRSIDVRFLWSLESIGITDSPKASREEEVVKFFNETTVYNDGRYEVKWPWVEYPPELPTNYGLAYGRLKGLLKRSDKGIVEEYNSILQEQLRANIIEVIPPAEIASRGQPVHYLPHHMVKQPGKRGRLVYDASAKMKNNKSLNECLYSGPCMLEDLTGLILKFRMGRIGMTADVEKAFLQVGLQREDRDVTRFLWIKDPTKELNENNLIHLRFCRVPFGIISSPFLLTATIRHHIAQTNEGLLKEIADQCYVDNLVLAVNSVEKAKQIYNKANEVFQAISMNLRDWMSNDEALLKYIPDGQKSTQRDQMKVLGLLWNIPEDTLALNVHNILLPTSDRVPTKKDILRTLARIYDPCGFVSPLILPAKLLFQELCERKLKWDSPLPEELQEQWKTILQNLQTCRSVEVPRYAGNKASGVNEGVTRELHCFADASKNAYAAVCYLREVTDKDTKTIFLMSKSRVTPVEDKSELKIPRLELLAYLIGSRLLRYIKNSLNVDIARQVLWTDSLIVLSWMKSNKLLPPFVQRRVNEIKQSKEVSLRYVNTKANPADIATRPELWLKKREVWFHGPTFLSEGEDHWPRSDHMVEEEALCLAGEVLDVGEGPEMISRGYEQEETDPDMLECQADDNAYLPVIRNDDESLLKIKELQKEHFPDEVLGKETSLKRSLDLFCDVDGILRCRGRLSHTNWAYDKRYPILIPKNSMFTNNIIQKVHEDNYHVGVSHTLSIIREKYWIPQGRAQIQKMLKRCPQCVKHGGGPYKLPPAPALPSERVNYSTPFTFTGLDYLGPILVAGNKCTEKRWICLFTCLAVRSVHLEVVNDLTAEECLLAIRRFVATRGAVQVMLSDNALQFKLTSEVLASSFCTEKNIQWKFITPLAPWQGGFYERLVALVKHCLKRTLDKHLLKDNQLQTVIKEIEAVINSRPLTTVGSELEEVLRPADFLTLGKCIEMNPAFKDLSQHSTSTKVDLVKGWKKGQIIVEEYKNMFMNQYLPSLRERYNHVYRQPRVKSHEDPQVGAVVQIKDDSKNRTKWKVGKIVSLIKGKDGQCRAANVKVGNSEFTRSIAHLYPLEMEVFENETQKPSCHRAEVSDNVSELPNTLPLEVPVVEDPQVPQVPQVLGAPQVREAPQTLEAPQVQKEQQVLGTPPESEVPEVPEVPQVPVEFMDVELEEESPEREITQDSLDHSLPSPGEKQVSPIEPVETNLRRQAAIRAREKIAEWTSQLLALL